MRPYLVGNWKMNGTSADLAEISRIAEHAARFDMVDVALCLPATLIAAAQSGRGTVGIGGQDCHAETSGAYTGSISAEMLAGAGASLCIVGHSERRTAFAESDAAVQAKAAAALAAGLDVIICVGESLATREAGEAEAFVLHQLHGSWPGAADAPSRLAIAYEPIWAIGTGRTAQADEVAAMHAAIRAGLVGAIGTAGQAVRILYGGSANPGNAHALLSLNDVGGLLVGGASLKADTFNPMIEAAAQVAKARKLA